MAKEEREAILRKFKELYDDPDSRINLQNVIKDDLLDLE